MSDERGRVNGSARYHPKVGRRKVTIKADMAAFDKLPRLIRLALNHAASEFNAESIVNMLALGMSVVEVLRVLTEVDPVIGDWRPAPEDVRYD